MLRVNVLDLGFLSCKNTIASFLIKGKSEDYGDILVETGPYTTWDTLSSELMRCGSSVDRVRHVFLTHIHLDHAGAAWAPCRTRRSDLRSSLRSSSLEGPFEAYKLRYSALWVGYGPIMGYFTLDRG